MSVRSNQAAIRVELGQLDNRDQRWSLPRSA
jgi:hypothetical protein